MALESQVQAHLVRLNEQDNRGQVVAFFDLDRTLIAGYSVVALLLEWLREGRSEVFPVAKEVLTSLERGGSVLSYARLYRRLVKGLAGTSDKALRAVARIAFERHVEASLFREARQIIRHHRELGHHVVIVSAATSYQVEPVAAKLGADAFLSTRLQLREGCLTGEIEGRLCLGEGKLIAARRYLRGIGARIEEAWFYADSREDLPLMKRVGFPVPTNASPGLAGEAARRDWQMLNFSSRGKVNLESLLRTVLTANSLLTGAAAGAASWLLSRSRSDAINRMTGVFGDHGAAFAGLDFEIDGTPHLEAVRPAIFVFNHQSFLDAVVMAHLVRHDFVAFCKEEVAANPILGPLMKAHGTIFVRRGAPNQRKCLAEARSALQSGKSLLIAPEGTRSATGELDVFKEGAFYLARRMQVPIIPVVLHNVSDAMPKGRLLLRPATIQVTVLPPLDPLHLGSPKEAGALLRQRYIEVMRAPFGARRSGSGSSLELPGSQ